MQPVEKLKIGPYKVKIYLDEISENPLDMNCMAGELVLFPSRGYKSGSWGKSVCPYSSRESVSDWLNGNRANIALVVGICRNYDGTLSGKKLERSEFNDLDGLDGVYIFTHEVLRDEWPAVKYDKAEGKRFGRMAMAERHAKAVLSEYSAWACGEVYGYVVTNKKTGLDDSCWGFYGLKWCRQSIAEIIRNDIQKQLSEPLDAWAK